MEKYEIIKFYQSFLKRINDIKEVIKPQVIEQEINKIEDLMSTNNFWDNQKEAMRITSLSKELKNKLTKFNEVYTCVEDLGILIELDDEDLVNTGDELVSDLEQKINEYEIELLLSDKYDSSNCLMEIHPGAGGTESQDWALMLYRMYKRYTERKGFSVDLIDYQEANDAGIKSVTIGVNGINAYGYLKAEKGVHRLIRISPFDSNARRHTSFAGVNVYPEIIDDDEITINPDDLKVDTYRSSGAGGQHVNTTDSAVRITHLPSGIVVSCQNERSQIQNKEKALSVLKAKLFQLKSQNIQDELRSVSGKVTDNAFGSQIRTYTLHPYSLVKDHRTNIESGNPTNVLDGDLDVFINGYLQKINSGD